MCRVQPDIISFDAHEGLDLFFADWHALDFVQQGGTVAYGIVPTRPGVNAVDSASIFIRWPPRPWLVIPRNLPSVR
jgi:hypothetical protein